jgi:hypothetical protein
MPSTALTDFLSALEEVSHLTSMQSGGRRPDATALRGDRVLGRAAIVLVSSHFERYVRAINEEVVDFLNAAAVMPTRVPVETRLLHSQAPIDELAATGWEKREAKLLTFITTDSWLWGMTGAGRLEHSRLLRWMKAPSPDNLVRYYKYWGITDIFAAITRSPQTRGRLWLGIKELVERRNNIAHGDLTAQATGGDVRRYLESARSFCARSDRRLGRVMSLMVGKTPW